MPPALERGQVTIDDDTIFVKPFHWPAAPLRLGIHTVQAGRLIEIDDSTRLQDIDVILEGDEETGWATMDDAAKAAIEALFQTGVAFTVTDWRGNTGSFFFLEAPQFEDLTATEDTPLETFWKFRFRLGRVS